MVTREQFQEAHRKAMEDEGQDTIGRVLESMLWELFDSPDAKAREIDLKDMKPISIQFTPPPKKEEQSLEMQLAIRSGTGKAAMFWFTPDGKAITWWTGMTYMEKLFLEDSFKARREWEIKRANEEDGG